MAKVFKVNVEYKDGAHEPQVIAVSINRNIRTAADAAKHCLAYLHHKDECGDVFPCVKAVPVRAEPFDECEAPRVRSMTDAEGVPLKSGVTGKQ